MMMHDAGIEAKEAAVREVAKLLPLPDSLSTVNNIRSDYALRQQVLGSCLGSLAMLIRGSLCFWKLNVEEHGLWNLVPVRRDCLTILPFLFTTFYYPLFCVANPRKLVRLLSVRKQRAMAEGIMRNESHNGLLGI